MTRARDTNLVKLRREELGMQLTELAAAIERSPAFVSQTEGGFVPQRPRQEQIATALQSTPEDLWPGEYA